ncbi:hypothetical protein CAC42_1060 [Sphaceloma murrayae]|uniref:Peptidase S54 rhomboid domain-containing protein n=1 Tax=Sphaceloma murrayae TaxID=2082308 RepID=A0A2K1R1X1_9PEZI|nr:hypothetical protein CAC42_1060 [Sphaceloma murrayae]
MSMLARPRPLSPQPKRPTIHRPSPSFLRMSELFLARSSDDRIHLVRRMYSSGPGSDAHASAKYAWFLIAALAAVPFAITQFAAFPGSSPEIRKMAMWLRDNFAFSYANASDKPWTFVTAGFMHTGIFHILFNMLTLRTGFEIMGFCARVSSVQLISLHLAGVLGGTLVSYLSTGREVAAAKASGNRMRQFEAEQRRYVGASAGVSGVLVAASIIAPRFPITIMFIPIAVPLAGATAGFLFLDAYLMGSATSFVAHEGHIGGALAGGLYYLLRLRR